MTLQPYTQFPRNVRQSHRRIATFLIIAPYKNSYLLTDKFHVDIYLWQLYEKACAKKKLLLEGLKMLYSNESLRNETNR